MGNSDQRNGQDQCVMEVYLKSVPEGDYMLKTKWGQMYMECF
jgi:hypothetical protein